MEHAYWGEEHGPADIEAFLKSAGVRHELVEDDERRVDRVAASLAEGKVVGWFQGRFEWGPRALGNRSILADPRRASMKDVVNTKIKFREPYRPFAPSVLVERAAEYFELADPARTYPARFMLLVVKVREGKRTVLPATTHVDGTGRVQVVLRETNPTYHRLIERFGEATGVPVLLNTSFNLRGEPIVASPADAYSTFRRSGLDLLALGPYLIAKTR
jgi:carbamoyltransferase